MENILENFVQNIYLLVLNKKISTKGLLVKKHTEDLLTNGEFSFPNNVKCWHVFIPSIKVLNHTNTTLLEFIGKSVDDLLEESKKCNLQVKTVKELKGRVHMFLERPTCMYIGLTEALTNIEYIMKKINIRTSTVIVDQQCDDINSITYLRIKYLSQVVQNLCSITDSNLDDTEIIVTSKSSSKHNGRVVLCGQVLNAKTGSKETEISADDYIRIRKDEMALIAQHKYGVRMSTDTYNWKESMENLGESAVAFELLQTKPSCSVKVNFDCLSAGSSKGVAFIMYNCARLEHIIMNFMKDRTYPSLPDLKDIDYTLLTHEDEWSLIFNYIMSLPTLLRHSVELDGNTCEFRPHNICNFLSSLVLVFSRYYRKVKILMMPRQHLLPVIFARICMLTILNDTIKTCLRILNMKTVLRM